MLCWFLPHISMNQSQVWTCPLSRSSRSSQSIQLCSVCSTTSHQLAISCMGTYVFQCCSFSFSHPLLSPLFFFPPPLFFLNRHTHKGNGTPLQYSCLENPMDGGAWQAVVHGVAKSRTRLSDFTFTFHFPALEKEMATHSSIVAQRTPWTEEPGGLQSMGSQKVRHD